MSIVVDSVSKRFGDFVALNDVSLEVRDGSLTALLGPSGGGKSTLLRVIAGLEQPDSGRVLIAGEDATQKPPQRRNVGFVFQHYAAFKHMTVRKNVAFGLTIRKRPKDEIDARVDELLKLVHLDGFASRYPLSSPAVSASAWPWPGRWPCSPACCCSTSPSGRSTPPFARSCAPGCGASTTRFT